MLKNILNLEGAQQLSKTEQNAINGSGGGYCFSECNEGMPPCPENSFCVIFPCHELVGGAPYGLCVSNGGNQ